MHVYVIRHAEAAPVGEQGARHDDQRRLTPHGEAQCRALARSLDRMGVRFEVLLTSPLARARQTAEGILAGPTRLEECPALAPGGRKRHVLEHILQAKSKSLGVVGHNPDLGELIGWFIGDKTVGVELDKAGVACIAFDGKPGKDGGALVWMVTPEWSAAVAGPDAGAPGAPSS